MWFLLAHGFQKRGRFFLKLKKLGLNFKVYGTRWDKDPNFKDLRSNIQLGHVQNLKGMLKSFKNSIQIALSIFFLPLSRTKSRFSITRRGISEITAIGTLLCSFKTKTMTENFIENKIIISF